MNKYCLDLNFNFPCIKESFDFNQYKGTPQSSISFDNFEDKFVKLLAELGLKITWAEIFHAMPRSSSVWAIHTDNTGGDYVKMNWIFGGKNSLMQWFDVKPNIVKEPVKTPINSLYVSYRSDEVSLAHQQSVKFPSIVQVGVPHNVYNTEEDRFCVSVMLRDKDNNRMTMERAQHLFSNYIS
jgi:hypothetical protein